MKWKSITSITLDAALLGASALAQNTTPPSTGAGSGPAQTTDATKAPAATQPGGTMSGTDTAKTPAMTQGSAGKSKAMSPDMTKASAAMKGERGRSVQEALKAKEYDPGPVDRVVGPKTQTALKEFQKAENLPESGRHDAQTLAKLGGH